jgi:hypothetical protein
MGKNLGLEQWTPRSDRSRGVLDHWFPRHTAGLFSETTTEWVDTNKTKSSTWPKSPLQPPTANTTTFRNLPKLLPILQAKEISALSRDAPKLSTDKQENLLASNRRAEEPSTTTRMMQGAHSWWKKDDRKEWR